MSGPLDFTNENIENTYQRVLQTDGTDIYDGTGSLFTVTAVAAPAGPDQSVQFNDAGATSGSGTFTFNKSANIVNLTGSMIASSGFTGSFYGTASWAESSSQATSASYALSSSYSLSSSFATTASYVSTLRATGSNTEIQFNNNGLLRATASFLYNSGLYVLNSDKIYQGNRVFNGIIGPTGQKTANERGIYSEYNNEGDITQYPIASYNDSDGKYYFADYKVNYNTNNTSLTVTGSLLVTGSTQGGGTGHILTYNTSSGEVFFTASSAIGNSIGSSLYLFNNY